MSNAKRDFWRNLNTEFTALAEEEWTSVPDPADNRRLRAYGNTDSEGNYAGGWSLSEGPNENFRARFAETATRAGHALDPPPGNQGPRFLTPSSVSRFVGTQSELRTGQKSARSRTEGTRAESYARFAEERLQRHTAHGCGEAGIGQGRRKRPPKLVSRVWSKGHRTRPDHWERLDRYQVGEELEISFPSCDERVQLTVGVHTETRNYAELGFDDGRNHKPNLAVGDVAFSRGTRRDPRN